MKTTSILIAGFGGQGTLFAGKVLAVAGLNKGLEVTWLPSYGPEMRGGTANCSVIISDSPIGSPIVSHPDILIALNKPSFEKYEKATNSGGIILVDTVLVDSRSERDDVKLCYVPASDLAREAGRQGLSNIVLISRAMRESGIFSEEDLKAALEYIIPKDRFSMHTKNFRAVELGMQGD